MVGAAISTASMNQRAQSPWRWPVTLGLSVNLFILVSMLHRLAKPVLYSMNSYDVQGATVGLWMVPSPSNEYPGTPYIPGALLTIITCHCCCSCPIFRVPSVATVRIRKACGIAPMIVTLHNIYTLSAFGLSGASVISALGFTVIGEGEPPSRGFPRMGGVDPLGLITIGVTVLLNRRTSARKTRPGGPRHASSGDRTASVSEQSPLREVVAPPPTPASVSGVTRSSPSAPRPAPNSW